MKLLQTGTEIVREVLGHEEEGWYSGQLKGQTGGFPFNYVEELSHSLVQLALYR